MYEETKDYYKVLGLDRLASQQEVKKAYKKLAIIYHPDKNLHKKQESINMFRQISQAYQILSDSEKRKNYDIYGFNGINSRGFSKFNFADAQSLFRKFFQTSHYDSKIDQEESADSQLNSGIYKNKFKNNQSSSTSEQSNSFSFYSNFSNTNIYNSSGYDKSNHLLDIGGQGISKSVSTITRTVNGKTVTVRRTTIKKKDGTKDVTEETIDGETIVHNMYSLAPGQGFGNKAVNYN